MDVVFVISLTHFIEGFKKGFPLFSVGQSIHYEPKKTWYSQYSTLAG